MHELYLISNEMLDNVKMKNVNKVTFFLLDISKWERQTTQKEAENDPTQLLEQVYIFLQRLHFLRQLTGSITNLFRYKPSDPLPGWHSHKHIREHKQINQRVRNKKAWTLRNSGRIEMSSVGTVSTWESKLFPTATLSFFLSFWSATELSGKQRMDLIFQELANWRLTPIAMVMLRVRGEERYRKACLYIKMRTQRNVITDCRFKKKKLIINSDPRRKHRSMHTTAGCVQTKTFSATKLMTVSRVTVCQECWATR